MRIIEALSQHSSDKEILLAHILKCQTIELYKNPRRIISRAQYARFRNLIAKHQKGWPMAYLTGHKEFMSLDFKVTPEVLIPRPETELLVEQALGSIEHLAKSLEKAPITLHSKPETLIILDLGTGSGNIAVSLAHYTLNTLCSTPFRIFASDISRPALRIARLNARQHQAGKYIKFCYGDLFKPFKGLTADIIVSNPPYVDRAEKSKWQSGLRHEPPAALWAGKRGLSYIEKIIKQAPDYLKPGGYLLLEIGIGQAKETLNLAGQSGQFRDIRILNDYSRIPRVFLANRR
ncbi:MAG: peptide chain release factor N(5)-glutamine methyltransferase [Planctomycetes bacterium]|nr:peptide chain release factor N(5)-glutamine methyltransferase [Planctomycetota bacterium]